MPASDPITAIANAISAIGGAVTPYIEEELAQRYEREFRERIKAWNAIQDSPDRVRPTLVHSHVMQLLDDAGATVGSMGTNVSVPVGVLGALINEVAEGIKKDKILARLSFKK